MADCASAYPPYAALASAANFSVGKVVVMQNN
jgi:hypothetical protein